MTDLTPEREQELREIVAGTLKPKARGGGAVLIQDARALLIALDAERARAEEAIREVDGMARAPYGEFTGMRKRMKAAEARNRNLEAALAFYADPDSWEPRTQRVRPAVADGGNIARAALAVLEEPQ